MALSVNTNGGALPKYTPVIHKESWTESLSLLSAALTKMDFGKGETILDFGCGYGSITTKFLAPLAEKHGSKIFAVDNAPDQIEYARENNSHPNVYYVCGDITSKQFPLTGVRFNKILCYMVLEKIQAYGELVSALAKLLKPNGTLWVLTMADKRMFRCLCSLKAQEKFTPYMDEVTIPDWVREDGTAEGYFTSALQKENINAQGMVPHTIFLNFDEFREIIHSQACSRPGLPEMTPNILDEFNEVLRKEFALWKGNEMEFKLLSFSIQNLNIVQF